MSRSRARAAVLTAVLPLCAVLLLAPAAPAHGHPDRATAGLARDSLRASLTRERFYFVMPDRFANGDTANDQGGTRADRARSRASTRRARAATTAATSRAWSPELDYIKGLGTTAIWLTPSFKNKPVQGLGTPFPAAGYHGYWITDFTQIDPHLGTNAGPERPHRGRARQGMKVFFDIITNHTADVIDYREAQYDYVSKATSPYRDANGHRLRRPRLRRHGHVPDAGPRRLLPLHAVLRTRGDEHLKTPAWLNDPRSTTTAATRPSPARTRPTATSSASTTCSPRTRGRQRHGGHLQDVGPDFGIDGFRIDTVKHVNIEFWQQFLPATSWPRRDGRQANFFMFGEVSDARPGPFLSQLHDRGPLPGGARLPLPAAGARVRRRRSRPTSCARSSARTTGTPTRTPTPTSCPPSWATTTWATSGCSCATTTRARRSPSCSARRARPRAAVPLARQSGRLLRRRAGLHRRGQRPGRAPGHVRQQGLRVQQPRRRRNRPAQRPEPQRRGQERQHRAPTSPRRRTTSTARHPLYRTIAGLARLRQTNPALADGAQQTRYSSPAPGIFAFSRTDAREQVEYLVALNNSTSDKTATIPTYSSRIGSSGSGAPAPGG